MADPRTVSEALEQAQALRIAEADPDARHRVVMEQIADALIGIHWWLKVIGREVNRIRTDAAKK